jgi:hypothetical protein
MVMEVLQMHGLNFNIKGWIQEVCSARNIIGEVEQKMKEGIIFESNKYQIIEKYSEVF